MCSCSIASKNNVKPGIVGIPASGIVNEDIGSMLALAWCQNSEKVQKAFKDRIGMDVNSSELIILAQANRTGADVQKYNVSFKDIVKGIKFTQEERNKAVCTI